MNPIPIRKLHPDAILPARASAGAAGYDLSARLDAPLTLAPMRRAGVPTGLAMAIPAGYAGFVFARSGLGLRAGISLPNGVGVIDSDYRGEVVVALVNLGDAPYTVHPGDRIAQLVISPVAVPDFWEAPELPATARGEGGFGSTGIRS